MSHQYHFLGRLGTSHTAVVYKAIKKSDNTSVAIKIVRGDEDIFQPKLVNLVSCLQGSPHLPRMICWHSLAATTSFCIVSALMPNDSIEDFVVGDVNKIRKYFTDLIKVPFCSLWCFFGV